MYLPITTSLPIWSFILTGSLCTNKLSLTMALCFLFYKLTININTNINQYYASISLHFIPLQYYRVLLSLPSSIIIIIIIITIIIHYHTVSFIHSISLSLCTFFNSFFLCSFLQASVGFRFFPLLVVFPITFPIIPLQLI